MFVFGGKPNIKLITEMSAFDQKWTYTFQQDWLQCWLSLMRVKTKPWPACQVFTSEDCSTRAPCCITSIAVAGEFHVNSKSRHMRRTACAVRCRARGLGR